MLGSGHFGLQVHLLQCVHQSTGAKHQMTVGAATSVTMDLVTAVVIVEYKAW